MTQQYNQQVCVEVTEIYILVWNNRINKPKFFCKIIEESVTNEINNDAGQMRGI